jgi:hypothetical protein
MPILSIVIVLVLVGLGLYIVNTYVPMAGPIKTILNVVVVLVLCVWLLNAFGIVHLPLQLR